MKFFAPAAVADLHIALSAIIQISPEEIREHIGNIAVLQTAEIGVTQEKSEGVRSIFDSLNRTTVFFADRFPHAECELVLKEELARIHGEDALRRLMGEACEVVDTDQDEDFYETEYGVNELLPGGGQHNPFNENFSSQEEAVKAGEQYLRENPKVDGVSIFELHVYDDGRMEDFNVSYIERSAVPQISENSTVYELPCSKDVMKAWIGCKRKDFEPSKNQQLVVEAVAEAVKKGMFRTVEIRDFCAKILHLTDEQLARNFERMPTEGGVFGMECYYANDYISAQKSFAQEHEVLNRLQPHVGQVFGALVFNDGKRRNRCVVKGVLDNGEILIQGKIGSNEFSGAVSAVAIMRAIDRAFEKKARKDDYSEFVTRIPRPAPGEQIGLSL